MKHYLNHSFKGEKNPLFQVIHCLWQGEKQLKGTITHFYDTIFCIKFVPGLYKMQQIRWKKNEQFSKSSTKDILLHNDSLYNFKIN